MSEKEEEDWKRDDDFLVNDAGRGWINKALEARGLSLTNTITSRDVGVDMARYELRRKMPQGWYSWMLPIYLLERKVTYFFLQTALPGTVLPSHDHDVAQFRIVLAGRLIYTAPAKGDTPEKSIELGCGDWIYTPARAVYTLSVATNPGHNALIHYCY